MLTFNLQEVRKFTADIGTKLDACDNGEGMECATLESSLQNYAEACCEFCENVRKWGQSVFSGQTQFNREVELMWIEEGKQLYRRAFALWSQSKAAELPCFRLEGQPILQASLWQLYRLVFEWVSPKLAVGPSARHPITNPVDIDKIKDRIASLPPLPPNWEPSDKRQRLIFRKSRSA